MYKVLIIRFSSIGDIVLTSPVIRCFKQQVPDAEVHFITKKQFAPVLQHNPNVDKLWLYEGNFGELIPKLKAERFDYVVDLHKNFRSIYLRSRLGRPSGSFTKLNFRKWLMVTFKLNLLPPVHIVDRYFGPLLKEGVKNDFRGLDYFIVTADEVVPPYPAFIAVVTGGKHNTKIFPAAKVAEVINRLKLPVILLGGKEDHERGEEILRMVMNPVVNACGSYSLNQSASLLRQSSAVITNDTGLMHIAAAFSKKIVSVWGNTIPEFGMYPYLPGDPDNSYIAEVKGLPCRPCSKIGYDECPKKHFRCMKDISVDDIVTSLE